MPRNFWINDEGDRFTVNATAPDVEICTLFYDSGNCSTKRTARRAIWPKVGES